MRISDWSSDVCSSDLAVHPGYGFLSEREWFATALGEAGIAFIGPRPRAIAAMGDKIESKQLAREPGLSVVAGFVCEIEDTDHAVAIADGIGYTMMIKASYGRNRMCMGSALLLEVLVLFGLRQFL